jgi:hypothetical protein
MTPQLTPISSLPIYIFDLDGTMALNSHRRHEVEAPPCPKCDGSGRDVGMHHNYDCGMCNGKGKDPKFKPDWSAFYQKCIHDAPNWPVIGTFLQLYSCGCDCRIWSGRSDEVQAQTIEWLHVYLSLLPHHIANILKMRPSEDFTPDDQLKRKWLHLMDPKDRARLAAVFDDRNKVVDMWRAENVTCFQVAPGDF